MAGKNPQPAQVEALRKEVEDLQIRVDKIEHAALHGHALKLQQMQTAIHRIERLTPGLEDRIEDLERKQRQAAKDGR
jgi:hypothetical protein